MNDDAVRVWLAAARRVLLDHELSADALYNRWFHRHTGTTLNWPEAAAFRAITLNARAFEPGWQVVGEAGSGYASLWAMRGGHRRLLVSPEFAPCDGSDLRPSAGTPLWAHPLACGESGGFWHLWSAGWQKHPPRRMQRLYVQVRSEYALELARQVAQHARVRDVWALKILSGAHEAGRRDRAVVYLPADVELPSWWLQTLWAFIQDAGDDDLPPFVHRLSHGLGHALDPGGGRSWGQVLCAAVAGVATANSLTDADAFERAAQAAIRDLSLQIEDVALPLAERAETAGAAAQPKRWIAPDDTDGLRAAAIDIANRLAASAIWSDGQCTFYGSATPMTPGSPPRFHSVGGDFYEGTAGIARFLARASLLNGAHPAVRTAAQGALRHALTHVEGWALFTGGLGIGLAALESSLWLQDTSLVDAARRSIDRAASDAQDAGAPHDLLVGTAGVIVGLVRAQPWDTQGSWRKQAFSLGDQLLAAAVSEATDAYEDKPLRWRLVPGEDTCLCGLAHGAAGVALAFESLAAISTDPSGWRRAARQARAFERAHFSPEHGSFADRRVDPQYPAAQSWPHMWCHGSIGIAAERLAAVPHDMLARADAVGALAGARAHALRLLEGPVGPGAGDEMNASLCHGTAGLVDLFIDAWCATRDESWLALAREIGSLMLNDARRVGGWRSGVPGGWPTPGFMLGESGAGWALLRLSDPKDMPSAWRLGVRAC